jgi:hypothetical protein
MTKICPPCLLPHHVFVVFFIHRSACCVLHFVLNSRFIFLLPHQSPHCTFLVASFPLLFHIHFDPPLIYSSLFSLFIWFILPPLSMVHAHPDLFLPCRFLLLGTPLLFVPLTLPPCCSSLTLFAVPEHQCLPAPSKSSTISVFHLRGQV